MRKNLPKPESKSAERLAFEIYLRTGRRLSPTGAPERKFNPYHDPRNGQFTFAPGGPKSIADPIFSDKRGLWKQKAQLAKPTEAKPAADVSKPGGAKRPAPRVSASKPKSKTALRDEIGAVLGRAQTDLLSFYLPVAPRADRGFLLISDTDDGAEHANCPPGSTNCRATATVVPRNSDDIDFIINEYRKSILLNGWKDNDFQNLVDMRYGLYVRRAREAIAAHIANWDPTDLLPEDWIAEHAIDLDYNDPESFARRLAHYMTLGIDGPGPRPTLFELENGQSPTDALAQQAEWAKNEAIHQTYQALVGSDPIFASTPSVKVSGRNARTRGDSYEPEIRGLYGGPRENDQPLIKVTLDGKTVSSRADYATIMAGKSTAIDAKYTDDWMASLRNPESKDGSSLWSKKAQREMIFQARKYAAIHEGGVVYHTNSVQFARFYSKVFRNARIENFRFIITPSR